MYTEKFRLDGRVAVVTGGGRGIGLCICDALAEHGAHVIIADIDEAVAHEGLAKLTAQGHSAEAHAVDVTRPAEVNALADKVIAAHGRVDILVANAGIAKQLPIIGGQPDVMEAHLRVNTLGVFYTLRAAGPHISHERGYALATASLAAAVHLPLLGAYSASKAAVEAIGNTFRQEIKPTGAKVGVAYYSELATDMISRGFDTVAGKKLTGGGTVSGVAPVEAGLRALERGIAKRSRRIAAPGWVPPVVPLRHVAQRVIELKPMPDLEESLEIARTEQVAYTTEQPTGTTRALGS